LPIKHREGKIIPVETRAWSGKWNGKDSIFLMSRELSKEQEALEKFNRLFSRNPFLMATSSLEDGRFTDINDSFLHTLGYSREEIIGRTSDEMALFIQPEELLKTKRQLRTTGGIVDYEMKVKCKDGKVLDGLFSGEIIESQGEKCYLTVMIDITERKQAQEKIKSSLKEKEILLKEIHHRVKNNLQAISSLLSLQAGKFQEIQLHEAFNQMKNRIKSIALVHEKLYSSHNLAHIEFAEQIRCIVHELVLAYGSDETKVEMEMDTIDIELEKAVPLSLILNELVSNALIHGFPDRSPGTLQISLHAADKHAVTLMIRDNGKGFPESIDFNDSSSLGLTLINALVHQIDGSIELNKEKGTTFTIKFNTGENST
jgi:PAS domain S-box-containing protein